MDLRLSQAGRSTTYGANALPSAVNGRCDDSHPNGRGQDRPNRGQYASGATQVTRPGRLHRRHTRQCRSAAGVGSRRHRAGTRGFRQRDAQGLPTWPNRCWPVPERSCSHSGLIWTTHRRRVPPRPAAADSAAVFVVQRLVPAGLDRFLCGRADGHRAGRGRPADLEGRRCGPPTPTWCSALSCGKGSRNGVADPPTIVIHPGPKGDRGLPALDWAVRVGEPTWGTALQAVQEIDAGPIWPSRNFPPSRRTRRARAPCTTAPSPTPQRK